MRIIKILHVRIFLVDHGDNQDIYIQVRVSLLNKGANLDIVSLSDCGAIPNITGRSVPGESWGNS